MARKNSEFVTDKEYIYLNSAGMEHHTREDGHIVRPNGRGDYQVLYIYEGLCRVWIDEEWHFVSTGEMILFRPFDPQIYDYYKSESATSYYMHFTGYECDHILREIGFAENRIINVGKSNTIRNIFEKTISEMKFEHPFSQRIRSVYLLEMLYRAGRKNIYAEDKTLLRNQEKVDIARQFMYENYSMDISRIDCARKCNLSVSRFSHIFKEVTGKAPAEYLLEIRILKATELLVSTDYSVAEIGERCGFPDSNYFSKTFKRYVGVSPKKYADSVK